MSGLIPAGATFDGLEVRWAYSVPVASQYLEYFWLEIPGVETTLVTDGHTAKAIAAQDKVAPYDSSDPATLELISTSGPAVRRYTIGNSTATWHVGLDIAGLRDPGFGVVMLADCSDYIEQGLSEIDIRVHYTGGDPMSVKDGATWKAASPHVNDGGIWKPAAPFTNDGGIWKSQ
ncbi:MAG: hypothetical protein ABJJ37_05745 [Roseibium sp.]